jgi:hypothetical protein
MTWWEVCAVVGLSCSIGVTLAVAPKLQVSQLAPKLELQATLVTVPPAAGATHPTEALFPLTP